MGGMHIVVGPSHVLKYTVMVNHCLGATYREIARILRSHGFERLQGSDWFLEPTDAVDTYWSMLCLSRVRPFGKFQSTVKGIKAHQINDWIFDITPRIRLGGDYSASLMGATPRELVPPNVPSQVPQQPLALPRYTQPSARATIVENWRVWPF